MARKLKKIEIRFRTLKNGEVRCAVHVSGKKIYGNKRTRFEDCFAFISGYTNREVEDLEKTSLLRWYF